MHIDQAFTQAEKNKILAALSGKGDDWTIGTGIYKGEPYYSAIRRRWCHSHRIYVRGEGFDRFLSILQNETRDCNGKKPFIIEEGNKEGPYFTQWRFDKLKDLAEGICLAVPSAANAKVWYDNVHDFHCLDFDVDDKHYHVEYYKIFTVTKEGIKEKMYFYTYDFRILDFFVHGWHRRWEENKVPDFQLR